MTDQTVKEKLNMMMSGKPYPATREDQVLEPLLDENGDMPVDAEEADELDMAGLAADVQSLPRDVRINFLMAQLLSSLLSTCPVV